MDNTTIQVVRQKAHQFNIEEAALLAVVEVESAGTPLWNVGGAMLPAIRFEGHYFYARLSGAKLQEAINQGLAAPKAGAVKNPRSFAARYALLDRARKIDANAADESVSWGLGQVMGANWKDLGYASVADLVAAAKTVEGQVEMMAKFVIKNNLAVHLKNHDWANFAKGYNGKNYRTNKYDTKLKEAYAKYSASPTSDYVVDDTANITQLQTMLNKVGTYNLTLDGAMGRATKAALIDFQMKNGLTADGIYGPITQEELRKDYLEVANKGQDVIGKIAGLGGAAGTALSEAAKQVEPLAATSHWLQYLFIALTVGGILLTLKATLWK